MTIPQNSLCIMKRISATSRLMRPRFTLLPSPVLGDPLLDILESPGLTAANDTVFSSGNHQLQQELASNLPAQLSAFRSHYMCESQDNTNLAHRRLHLPRERWTPRPRQKTSIVSSARGRRRRTNTIINRYITAILCAKLT